MERQTFDSSPKQRRVASAKKTHKRSPNTTPVDFKEGKNFANTAKITLAGMNVANEDLTMNQHNLY